MEINIREDRKLVEIWLANGEAGCQCSDICTQYNAKGYLVAVFRSGTEDLADLTAGLLLYNRKKNATL